MVCRCEKLVRSSAGGASEISEIVLCLVRKQMRNDGNTTAVQLREILTRHGIHMSLGAVVRKQQEFGWKFHGSACRKLIRSAHKQERMDWACENVHENLDSIIWSSEATVQFKIQPRGLLAQPRHYVIKACMWAAISIHGATKILVCREIGGTQIYNWVLESYLVPFIKEKFPGEHRFVQNNHPKHTSGLTRSFFAANGINWWRTPPESPDLNPIHNLWQDLQVHLRTKVRPRTESELFRGIKSFWTTVNPQKCVSYIKHLQKVIPKVIELEGAATGY